MKFNKHIFCTILFALFLGIGMLDAQVRVVNEDGDVIILMPDGSWKYEDDKKENARTDKDAPLPKNTVPATKQKPSKKENNAGNGKGKKPKNVSNKSAKSKKSKNSKKGKVGKSGKKTKAKKGKRRKAMVYPVPKRERKIKTPVIEEYICEYSMRERDEFTNRMKVATKPQPFFTYTQPDLKKFLRENDYITCSGYLSRVIGMTIFNIKFEIESTMAQQEYGEIQAGTQLLVKLLNGETVTLTCQERDKGNVDEINGKTIYRTYFSIDKSDMKQLEKSEVVKVRMLWSSGYEDYEVNELDFFINQLECLDQIKN